MAQTFLHTPIGQLLIKGDTDGISEINFDTAQRFSHSVIPDKNIDPLLIPAIEQLIAYFEGKLTEFDFKLNPKGTDFQLQVWKQLQDIPYGKTISYLDLAKAIHNPKSVRAVGTANGRNPLPIVIPCHRVIGSDRSLTGYGGGIWRKRWLLEHEGALQQLNLF